MHDVFHKYPEATCLVFDGENLLFQSTKKGVAPLLDCYNEHGTLENLTVYDRIVGRGAALLAVLIGATSIHTPWISEAALSFCKTHNVTVDYDTLVDEIHNRDNTGRCPIETSVLGVEDVNEGYHIIIDTLQKLKTSAS